MLEVLLLVYTLPSRCLVLPMIPVAY